MWAFSWGRFSEIPRACKLMSNHKGSSANLEFDSHLGDLCLGDQYFEKISLHNSLKLLFVAWVLVLCHCISACRRCGKREGYSFQLAQEMGNC